MNLFEKGAEGREGPLESRKLGCGRGVRKSYAWNYN